MTLLCLLDKNVVFVKPSNEKPTPAHIVPEWYFLWVYAILRSIPNKLGGSLLHSLWLLAQL